MKVAAFQFDVRRGDVAGNLAQVERALRDAARAGIELVVLPEMWPTSFLDVERWDDPWLDASERAVARLRELSGELDLSVCGSALGRGSGAGQARSLPRNRWHFLERGVELACYDKVHLFTPTAEPESFSAGEEPPPTVVSARGRFSGVVCYDLRFAALFQGVFAAALECLCVPAQWPVARASHWRALVSGRAVETQCFLIAANRTGKDLLGRRRMELEFPGNSLIVDPDGQVLAQGAGQEGLVSAEIDLSWVRALRVRVPVSKDRRPDLYRRWAERAG